MKREDWQKAYAPVGGMLETRVNNTLKGLGAEARGKTSVRRKVVCALAAVCMLAIVGVGASGLYSAEYDAIRIANRALAEEYGITEEMHTFFGREVIVEDGVTTVIYNGMEDMQHVLGQYKVEIRDGDVQVSWSHDGQSTEGELDAHAWGAQQLGLLIEIAKEEQGFSTGYRKAQELRGEMESELKISITQPDGKTQVIDMNAVIDETKIAVTEEEAIAIAKGAFAQEYGLTQAQLDQMEYVDEYAGYTYAVKDGKTVCEVWFWLHQDEAVYHTEGDGIYRADVNAETGVIEALYYDSALAGNG